MGLLDGKRLLVTGVITDASIAFHVAKIAQEQGAQVVLTGFGRMWLVERIAERLPEAAPVVELDVSDQEQLDSLAERVSRAPRGRPRPRRRPALDRLRAASCLGDGAFLDAPWEDVATAIQVERVLAEVAGRCAAAADRARLRRSSAWTSTPPGAGPPTTGWASPRPRSSRSTATWPATSARRASGSNLVRGRAGADDGRQVDPRRSPRSRTPGTSGRRSAGTSTTRRRSRRRVCALLSDWLPVTTGIHGVRGRRLPCGRCLRRGLTRSSLLSFGGPEGPEDVRPFLENVTRGRGRPAGTAGRRRGALPALRWGRPINGINRDADRGGAGRAPTCRCTSATATGTRYVEDTVAPVRDDGVRRAPRVRHERVRRLLGCRQYHEDIARARKAVGAARRSWSGCGSTSTTRCSSRSTPTRCGPAFAAGRAGCAAGVHRALGSDGGGRDAGPPARAAPVHAAGGRCGPAGRGGRGRRRVRPGVAVALGAAAGAVAGPGHRRPPRRAAAAGTKAVIVARSASSPTTSRWCGISTPRPASRPTSWASRFARAATAGPRPAVRGHGRRAGGRAHRATRRARRLSTIPSAGCTVNGAPCAPDCCAHAAAHPG